MIDLYQRSIEIILINQYKNGAYIASPNFPTYQYCWFRDASFIAYAMDLAGEQASAAKFHDWASSVILKRSKLIERVIARGKSTLPPVPEDQLHTRYTTAGEDGTREEWPNYQLDGLGTWLWALKEHVRLSREGAKRPWLEAARLVRHYLETLWQSPCYDCWEEFPQDIHLYTLSAIYGGLKALGELDTFGLSPDLPLIRAFVEDNGVLEGHFVKKIGSQIVDASLLGMAVPYRMVDITDQRYIATIKLIEEFLVDGGGVHRYQADTFYGGGEWVLLAGWLGWVYAQMGFTGRARDMLAWMETCADTDGYLPEQVPLSLNEATYYQPWVERWGTIARPLLWSHAMYIILRVVAGR